MKPRICIGCGEPILEEGYTRSRNPNICASCSSMADEMEEADAPKSAPPEPDLLSAHEEPEEIRRAA